MSVEGHLTITCQPQLASRARDVPTKCGADDVGGAHLAITYQPLPSPRARARCLQLIGLEQVAPAPGDGRAE